MIIEELHGCFYPIEYAFVAISVFHVYRRNLSIGLGLFTMMLLVTVYFHDRHLVYM